MEEGAFPRLQERAQTQLGFINSLLITLAIGLLAFAANASTNASDLNRLAGGSGCSSRVCCCWRPLFSPASGWPSIGWRRIASQPASPSSPTARPLSAQGREYELQRLGRQSVFFQHWGIGSLSKLPEKHQVRSAANDLVSLASVMGPGCCHEEGTALGHE